MMEGNRRPLLLIGGVVLVVLVVVIGAFRLFGGSKSKLSVTSIPNDLVLTLDGHEIPANGDVEIKSGSHTLAGSRRGFADYTTTIEAKDGDPLAVNVYLYANGPEGVQWVQKNPKEALQREAEAGKRFDEIQEILETKYPIIKQLPYVGAGFTATYTNSKSDPKNPEALSVKMKTFTSDGQQNALAWLKAHNWDPATLDIIWTTTG
jgi:hypothetical protein